MKTLFLILQIACIVMVATGIAIEYRYEAHIGFVFITAGAMAFALGEKLDKYRIKRDLRKSKLTKIKSYD